MKQPAQQTPKHKPKPRARLHKAARLSSTPKPQVRLHEAACDVKKKEDERRAGILQQQHEVTQALSSRSRARARSLTHTHTHTGSRGGNCRAAETPPLHQQ